MRWPFVRRSKHDHLRSLFAVLEDAHREQLLKHEKLRHDYELIKHGYEQGVLEGRRATFVEVRSFLADELFLHPQLRILAPKIAELGKAEDDQLAEMKGYKKARSVFQDVEPVQMFPTPAPQRAVEVPIVGLTQTIPVTDDRVVHLADGMFALVHENGTSEERQRLWDNPGLPEVVASNIREGENAIASGAPTVTLDDIVPPTAEEK